MIGTLCVCMPKLSTRRKPSLAAFTRSKERTHTGALCELVVEALQYNVIGVTDLYFDILQVMTLGGQVGLFLSPHYLEATSTESQKH